MTAHHRDTPPPLDLQRALTLRAYVLLVEDELSTGQPRAPERLIDLLERAGLMSTAHDGDGLTLTLWGIRSRTPDRRSQALPLAALRDWQTAARDRLALGLAQ
jgi:hypothetical protein